MLTSEGRTRIDRTWNDFWAGGIANPLEVMEQITYLLFIKRLDDPPDPEGAQGQPPGRTGRGAGAPRGQGRKGAAACRLSLVEAQGPSARRVDVLASTGERADVA